MKAKDNRIADKPMAEQLYKYSWANNPKRETLKNRICRVLYRGKMNSALIEFIDNNQREIVSRNALRNVRGLCVRAGIKTQKLNYRWS